MSLKKSLITFYNPHMSTSIAKRGKDICNVSFVVPCLVGVLLALTLRGTECGLVAKTCTHPTFFVVGLRFEHE
jgi:hypothetical protein